MSISIILGRKTYKYMKTIIEALSEQVGKAFEACGYGPELGVVTVSDRWDLCQFQCNGAFAGAKLHKKAPLAIATEVAETLNNNSGGTFTAEAFKPGFINIVLSDTYLSSLVTQINSDKHLGIPQIGQSETIVIDYGNANVAKPLHVGHMRTAVIGETLKRLAKAMGCRVIGDVHLGDWGLQMGLVIAEMEERGICGEQTAEALTADALSEIYPFASSKSKEDPEFKKKAKEITVQLQKGHEEYRKLGKRIVDVSVADMKKVYDRLDVHFDLWYGESNSEPYIEELLQILNEQNLMYRSEGALVVDVSEETDKAEIPPVIIKKSDGSNIYATTDLATLIQRQRDFAPTRVWYVVDNRQSMHFTQVFRCAKKAGIIPRETELMHVINGTVNGSDGKPYKTRDGGVMQLSEFLDLVAEKAGEKLAMAAIKFGDLINHRQKDYIFDTDKFLSSEGKTGVYLLYCVTRINSILKKVQENVDGCAVTDLSGVYSDSERELMLKILLSPECYKQAFTDKTPNDVCESAYQIATAFSKFYHDCHILTETSEEKRDSWLNLCRITRAVLLKHLEVLGIEPVDVM